MLATDPLSLVFLGCLLFSGVFLLVSLVTGLGHGHLIHAGHAVHAGHVIHAGDVAHAGHAGALHPADAGHAAAHAAGGHATTGAGSLAGSAAQSPLATLWSSATTALAGSLNVLSLLTFLFCFGLLGYLLNNFSRPGPFLALFVPAVFGAAAAIGVGVPLTRLFAVNTGELTTEGTRIEGRIGTVSMAIEPDHVGEVIFTQANGGRQSIGARGQAGEALGVGSEVVILAMVDGLAMVQSWDAFMRAARAGNNRALAEPADPPPPPAASR